MSAYLERFATKEIGMVGDDADAIRVYIENDGVSQGNPLIRVLVVEDGEDTGYATIGEGEALELIRLLHDALDARRD